MRTRSMALAEQAPLRVLNLPPCILSLCLPRKYATAVALTCRLLNQLARQNVLTFRIKCCRRNNGALAAAERHKRRSSEEEEKDFFADPPYATYLDNALAFAARLPGLTALYIKDMHAACADSTVARLAQLTQLTRLDISSGRSDYWALWNTKEFELLGSCDESVVEARRDTAATLATALSGLTRLRALNVAGNALDLAAVAPLSALTFLDFSNMGDDVDTEASVLRRLRALQHLNLTGVSVSGGFASHLTTLSLHTLLHCASLANRTITQLTTLEALDLGCVGAVKASRLRALSALTRLSHLAFDNATGCENKTHGAGATPLHALAYLPALRSVHLDLCRLGVTVLEELAALVQLQSLSLSSSGITTIDVGSLTLLTQLRLAHVQLDIAAVRSVASLPSVVHLDLTCAKVGNAAIPLPAAMTSVSALTTLRSLCVFSRAKCGDPSVQALTTLNRLTQLDLSCNAYMWIQQHARARSSPAPALRGRGVQ